LNTQLEHFLELQVLIDPSAFVLKLFNLSLIQRENKLECLSLASLSSLVGLNPGWKYFPGTFKKSFLPLRQ
jgi:hypothetical protein